jgi:hypothetical protein
MFAAGSLPTALVLMYAAIDPSVILQLSGMQVPIAGAGAALFHLSITTILSKK